jgi:LmbE family N-acetylglucosaminyl deacetylase
VTPDDLLDVGSLLVVAPHPDDEALGCGALIAALDARGARVAALFTTDGGASHPRSRLWPRRRLAALRRAEAAASLAALCDRPAARLHLDLPDADMRRDPAAWRRAVSRAAAFAREVEPELALLPWRRDFHVDHVESAALARTALALAGLRPRVLEYAVWADQLGRPEDRPGAVGARRLVFPAERWRPRKRAAVEAHRSQLGRVVTDDPRGFVLSPATLERLVEGDEIYWAAP